MIGHPRSRTGLTVIELATWIAVTAILAAILFPVLAPPGGCRGEGRTCLSNLKQLSLATMMYAQDYDDRYPAYRPDPKLDWSTVAWSSDPHAARHWRSSSFWV